MGDRITVALAGNPNAGKTTIFNALTGARRHVGNWPGVTVEKKEGTLQLDGREIHVVDLPGTYSLTAFSVEEIIARKFILDGGADVVVDVVDASNLERNLYLAVQLMEIGVKIVIALNMIDVARARRINIDHERLSQLLGVPIVTTDGKREIGVKQMLAEAVKVAEGPHNSDLGRIIGYGTEVEEELARIEERFAEAGIPGRNLSTRWLAVKLLEGDSEIAAKLEGMPGSGPVQEQVRQSRTHLAEIFGDAPEIVLADARYGFIAGALRQAVRFEAADRIHLSETIDKVLTNRLLGPIILILVLYGVYLFTFQGSEPLVKYFEAFFTWLGSRFSDVLPSGLLQSLIVSGIIDGVGGVLRFVPLIAFMFFSIAILEDTGYMARIAFMLDRVLRGFGLHGASMLALMVAGGIAGGCAVPGIMATRTLREPKERLVTILVTPLMNCGAKLPVYALLIGAFFPGNKAGIMLLLTAISWVMVLTAARVIRSTVLSGPSAPFVLELPPYRVPTLKGLLIHSWERTWMYIKKAATVILAVSVILWATMSFPSLSPEKARPFDNRIERITTAFLEIPAVKETFRSEEDLSAFRQFHEKMRQGNREELRKENRVFFALAQALETHKDATRPEEQAGSQNDPVKAYRDFIQQREAVERERQAAQLKNTIGGRIGTALEVISRPLNFDWRTNIALLGGFAAKEVVVSTLGTAYSLGSVDPKEAAGLTDRLKNEPSWNALTAFTLILFVMFYAPCFVTLVVMRKETQTWRWPFFAMLYTTALAYCVALVVYSAGSFLGLGTS